MYWNVNPEILSLGPIAIRWYGLFFALAFLLGFGIVRWIFRCESKAERDLEPLLFYMLFGTLIGARLGHCFFYDPLYYLSNPLEIIKVWKGGLASHGGAIGVFVALYLYSRNRPDQPYLWLLDRMVIPAALGGALIRIGNFFNSEIIGVPADVAWAIVFAKVDLLPRHPVQLYEATAYVFVFLLLIHIYRHQECKVKPGLLLGLYLVTIFTARFFIELLKIRQAAYGIELPFSVGQWLSLPMIIAGVMLLFLKPEKRRNVCGHCEHGV
ncbi:MAG: prolipoprotein diacylglyceryl transferase [Deltaproteobacteria bacterium]|nr:prolipoprotein diacylglyceryl transferase [Deltaproteobacteria bacterium]